MEFYLLYLLMVEDYHKGNYRIRYNCEFFFFQYKEKSYIDLFHLTTKVYLRGIYCFFQLKRLYHSYFGSPHNLIYRKPIPFLPKPSFL